MPDVSVICTWVDKPLRTNPTGHRKNWPLQFDNKNRKNNGYFLTVNPSYSGTPGILGGLTPLERQQEITIIASEEMKNRIYGHIEPILGLPPVNIAQSS
jgi:hypothetical protein